MQRDVRFGRNSSWVQSVLAGLNFGVWYAPFNLICVLLPPIATLLLATVDLLIRLVTFAGVTLAVIVAGFFGFIKPVQETKA